MKRRSVRATIYRFQFENRRGKKIRNFQSLFQIWLNLHHYLISIIRLDENIVLHRFINSNTWNNISKNQKILFQFLIIFLKFPSTMMIKFFIISDGNSLQSWKNASHFFLLLKYPFFSILLLRLQRMNYHIQNSIFHIVKENENI